MRSARKEVSPQEEPELHGIIERLCVQANLPKPRVAVIESSMPNACAMGRSPRSATVCATRGILELLDSSELEGVIGHELTHVINRDVIVMTLASFFASLAALIAQFSLFFGGGFGYNREEEEGALMILLVSVVVYAISFLLLQALSRYREFAADRGSAVLTGRPSALASALLKISGTIERVPNRDLRAAEGLSAFFIVPGADEGIAHEPLLRPSAAREAARRAQPSRGAAAGNRGVGRHALGVGLRDILTGRHQVQGPAPDRLFAIATAYITLQTATKSNRRARQRSSSSRSRPANSRPRCAKWKTSCAPPAARAAARWPPRTTPTATAG